MPLPWATDSLTWPRFCRADTAVQPPFFMKKEIMAETAQLEEFDEALYKVCDVLHCEVPG